MQNTPSSLISRASQNRSDAARAKVSIAGSLKNGLPVGLFPEGATTNGHQVLRFHATMLQPAIDLVEIVTPCAIAYELQDGSVEHEFVGGETCHCLRTLETCAKTFSSTFPGFKRIPAYDEFSELTRRRCPVSTRVAELPVREPGINSTPAFHTST